MKGGAPRFTTQPPSSHDDAARSFLFNSQVHLCGSFTRWVETVPMAAVPGSEGEFSVVVHLPPG